MSLGLFKDYVRKTVRRASFYQRARASWIYDLYWNVADRRVISQRSKEVDFYGNVLQGFRTGDLIFDIGANQGYKADIFFRLGARVVAVEPDEICQQILKEKFLAYRARRKPLTVIPKAISDRASVAAMWIDTPGSAKNTLNDKWVETLRRDDRFGQKLAFDHSRKVETMTLEQLMAIYGEPYFVKIDVEGHELHVLQGLRRPVPYLSFEVNLPEFRDEGLDCIRVLQRLNSEGRFNYTADCQSGLFLDSWVQAEEILDILSTCTDRSIEVFWNTRQPINNKIPANGNPRV